MAKAAPKRGKNKDNARRSKKKISVLTQEKVEYVDYKDVNLLRRFMSDRAKIRARRVTGNDSQQQKEIARAIKNAREMALLPYTSRVTTQRTSRDRGERGPRADAPMPMPTPATPPPTGGAADEDGEFDPTAELDGGEATFEAPADDVVETVGAGEEG
jgi:small subunit ribosomal protein S18